MNLEEQEKKEVYSSLNRYITESEVRTFGSFEFSSDPRWMVASYNERYWLYNLYGWKSGSQTLPEEYDYLFLAWYDYLEADWEKEVWMIRNDVFYKRSGRSDNYPHMTFTISDTGKRIYAIGFCEEGKTTLSIVRMK